MNPIFLPAPDDTGTVSHEELFTVQVTGLMQHPQARQSLREETLPVQDPNWQRQPDRQRHRTAGSGRSGGFRFSQW
ncbi:hypothetical protein [Xenorhabdus sp. SGI240]|uniref:hypothetical protein n=1 Tax=Xenorhabdus sp. SGI240 TaxID=3158262 RepID=UPI0032B77631